LDPLKKGQCPKLINSTGTEEGEECGHGQEAKVALQDDTEDTERKRGM